MGENHSGLWFETRTVVINNSINNLNNLNFGNIESHVNAAPSKHLSFKIHSKAQKWVH